MAIIKCKMCGGDVALAADKTFGTCEYCGNTMTFPRVDDEQRAAAFNRGNHFRRIGEFDKALAVYERIVQEDNTDAEAHWCCVLCRFGIEYVEDPATFEWLPTCHRASFDSILEDVDYLAAVEYSDGITRRQYQKDAAKIAEVQKGILATSQNAEPYDVFICYKETDEKGERTRDSLLAQEIYYQLTEQGKKVFFARITLEDVPGVQYEPYIFAALNSAKVMVVVGTKPEHLNAVWVKNEWSRFVAMMKKDRHKLLLPCYRDMDPYDLPEQLSVLQSYDMAKIGFIQDLIRGINKVLDGDKKPEPVKETVATQSGAVNTAPLLKRAFMFLEDRDWASADEYCEKVLDADPENALAYLGKLMAERQISYRKRLGELAAPFSDSGNYKKAFRFGDDALKQELTQANEQAKLRQENNRLEILYGNAMRLMTNAATEQAFQNAGNKFAEIQSYKDAAAKEKECRDQAEILRKDLCLKAAQDLMTRDTLDGYIGAMNQLKPLSGWRNADELYSLCEKRAAEIKEQEEAARLRAARWAEEHRLAQERKAEQERKEAEERAKRNKKNAIISISVACVVIAIVVLLFTVIIPTVNYNSAVSLMEEGKYEEAITAFQKLDGYSDSESKIAECKAAIQKIEQEAIDAKNQELYNQAVALLDAGKTKEAAIAFGKLGDYKDAKARSFALWDQFAVRASVATGGDHMVALKSDGTVVAVGDNHDGQCDVSGWTDIIAVAASEWSTVGLKADGTVVVAGKKASDCWMDLHDVVAIQAASSQIACIRADGTVVMPGDNTFGQSNVAGWTDIIAIDMDFSHTIGLKADGTVVIAGSKNGLDESTWSDIVAVAAGARHSVGLKADGTVVAGGFTSEGQCDVGEWTDIVAICAAGGHTVGIKADGTVVAVGDHSDGQCDVSSWSGIVEIDAAGGSICGDNTIGLKADGTAVAVGSNGDGQCEVGNWTNIKTK